MRIIVFVQFVSSDILTLRCNLRNARRVCQRIDDSGAELLRKNRVTLSSQCRLWRQRRASQPARSSCQPQSLLYNGRDWVMRNFLNYAAGRRPLFACRLTATGQAAIAYGTGNDIVFLLAIWVCPTLAAESGCQLSAGSGEQRSFIQPDRSVLPERAPCVGPSAEQIPAPRIR